MELQQLDRRLSILLTVFILFCACNSSQEKLICNSWKFGNFQITNHQEFDAAVQKAISQATNTISQRDELAQTIQQIRSSMTEESNNQMLAGNQVTFKSDHTFAMSGGTRMNDMTVSGTWSLNGNKLILAFQGIPGGSETSSDTSEIISLTKSQLVIGKNGAQTTYGSNN